MYNKQLHKDIMKMYFYSILGKYSKEDYIKQTTHSFRILTYRLS